MSSELRDLSKLPNAEFQRQLEMMQSESTRRLHLQMEEAQTAIDATLKRFPQFTEAQLL